MSSLRMRHFYDANRITIKGDFCVYCGDVSTTVEHYPPVSVTNYGFKLPCCVECNTLAVDENPRDFEKRVHGIKSKIRRKNWKWLQMPEWSHEELDDLSVKLRRDVIYALNRKSKTIKRLDFDTLAYIAVIDTNSEFEQFFSNSEVA
jgi:hypothetical protein